MTVTYQVRHVPVNTSLLDELHELAVEGHALRTMTLSADGGHYVVITEKVQDEVTECSPALLTLESRARQAYETLAYDARDTSLGGEEQRRLRNKAEGVNLVLSYIEEMKRLSF